MRIRLSEHFTYATLVRFVLPSIIMMIFTSIYGVVDGLFVSNYAGKTQFAAVNLIMPMLMVLGSLGFMFGTGGAAIVGKTLGEKESDKANRYFSMFIYATFAGGVVLSVAGQLFLKQIVILLGAEGDLLGYCMDYGRIILLSLPFFMLQFAFQALFVTAEKPKLGLMVTVISGVANIVLDLLFIAGFGWGIEGAAAATSVSEFAGGFIPVIYFIRKNDSLLSLVKTRFYSSVFVKGCLNGASELLTQISASVVTMLYNWQLLKLAGEDGVAAYGVVMYVAFIFAAIYIGYSMGSAPVISYNYGAEKHDELRNIFKKSMTIIGTAGISLVILAEIFAGALTYIFVSYDKGLYDLTVYGMRIYVISFLISGFNMFGSSFFTALNNGFVSALISFSRIIVFECSCVIILPAIFGLDGIWFAIIVAEGLAVVLTMTLMAKNRKRYGYI